MPPAHRRQLRPTGAERPGLTKQKQDRRHLARRRIAARERQLTAGGGFLYVLRVEYVCTCCTFAVLERARARNLHFWCKPGVIVSRPGQQQVTGNKEQSTVAFLCKPGGIILAFLV